MVNTDTQLEPTASDPLEIQMAFKLLHIEFPVIIN